MKSKPPKRLSAAVWFLVVSATLTIDPVTAQTPNDAIKNELAFVGINPCQRLLGGPPGVGSNPNTDLVGSLRVICTRGLGFVPPQTNAGGFTPGTPATAPGYIQRKQRKIRKNKVDKKGKTEGRIEVTAASADSFAEFPSGLSIFASAGYESFNKDVTEFESGYNSHIIRVTIGGDYKITKHLFAGLAFDYFGQHGDFKGGGNFDTNSYGILAFSSLFPSQHTFVNITTGFARQSYERTRLASLTDEETGTPILQIEGPILGNYMGNTYRAGVIAGYNHKIKTCQIDICPITPFITPYVGLNWLRTEYGAYSETGSARQGALIQPGGISLGDQTGLEMRFDKDYQTSLISSIGVAASMMIETNIGLVVPQIAAEWQYQFLNNQRTVTVGFAQDLRQKRFSFQTDQPDRTSFTIETGVVTLLPNGMQPFANFRVLLGHSFYENYGIVGGIRYSFTST